jgi:hypothetical protein
MYFLAFMLVPLIRNHKSKTLRKLAFDFFWGYGALKEILFPSASYQKK